MRYRKTDQRPVNTTASKRAGTAIVITKGVHLDKHGTIERVCNHSWYEILIHPNLRATLHTSYFRVAAENEQPPDPLAHLM